MERFSMTSTFIAGVKREVKVCLRKAQAELALQPVD
jgi:hypothetical protein